MADLEQYRRCVRRLLSGRAQLIWDDRVRAETIFDRARDRYLLVHVGWRGSQRVYDTLLHIDICGDRVWIQQDETATGVTNELIEMGIPQEDIILGFVPPSVCSPAELKVDYEYSATVC